MCALHSVPHSPRTAFLAAHSPCLCPAGMRPPRAASPGRLGPRSGPSPAAVVPEWAVGTEPGLTPSAAGPDPPAQASRAHASAHHVRRGSLARAGRRREGLECVESVECIHMGLQMQPTPGRLQGSGEGGRSRVGIAFGPADSAGYGVSTLDLAPGVRMERHVGPRGVGRAAAASIAA